MSTLLEILIMVLTAASQFGSETSPPQTSLDKDNSKCSINYKDTWSPQEQGLDGARVLDKARGSQGNQNNVGLNLFNKPRTSGFQAGPAPDQKMPRVQQCVTKGQEKFAKLEVNSLLKQSNSKIKEQLQHPRPPHFPRSHSSKNLQQTPGSNGCLTAGRRILCRSYSSPNISSTNNSIKLPKPTQDLLFNTGKVKGSNSGKRGNERLRNTVKELPSVAGKNKGQSSWRNPFPTSKMVKHLHQTFAAGKTSKPAENHHEDERMIKEIKSQSNGSEMEEQDEWDWRNLSSTNRHVVFVMNHDEGRLETLGTLQPVPEEPEHEHPTCNESPWHYYDNELRHHIVNDLFESDDDQGLILNSDSGLDPIKKAMINDWIVDVTLKTSQNKGEQLDQ